jgi:hypothetical protein
VTNTLNGMQAIYARLLDGEPKKSGSSLEWEARIYARAIA